MIAMADDAGWRPDHTVTADEERRRRRDHGYEACSCPPANPSPGWRPPSNRRERRLAAALRLKLLPMSQP